MSDNISVVEWKQHHDSNFKRPSTHQRSVSSSSTISLKPTSSSKSPISKSRSFSNFHSMAEVSHVPLSFKSNGYFPYNDEDETLSTLPDPRSRAMSPTDDNSLISLQHPGLNNEVATLSNKLIHAINHQTNLDDTLSATRLELVAARERVKILERENKKHRDLLARGFLVRKSAADSVQAKMVANISEERRKRVEVEKEKRNIELELENLTTALFEEANKMVITAREDARQKVEIAQKKNDQLKAQVADAESLLKSHQDQLAELKQVMEQMTSTHDDQTNQTSPSSPAFSKSYCRGDQTDETDMTHISSFQEPLTPTNPMNLTHLLQTILRNDIPSYHDFLSLLKMSKNNSIGNRASTGSYSGLGVSLGLSSHSGPFSGTSVSCSTLPLATTTATSPATPVTPSSVTSSNSTSGPNSSIHLKETKFYKRVLVEDIEPTLRLDSAPGISWLGRRSVINAVCEGTLIVEPMPSPSKTLIYTCALCGESRTEAEYVRCHRFKTSDHENAQVYPLCRYCLGRLRSTCDFLGFLRLLKDGHWRCDDEESEKAAWDESVRLREQMFWSRMGGGVVPLTSNHHLDLPKSPLISKEITYEKNWQFRKEIESEKVGYLKNDPNPRKDIDRTIFGTSSLSSPGNLISEV